MTVTEKATLGVGTAGCPYCVSLACVPLDMISPLSLRELTYPPLMGPGFLEGYCRRDLV